MLPLMARIGLPQIVGTTALVTLATWWYLGTLRAGRVRWAAGGDVEHGDRAQAARRPRRDAARRTAGSRSPCCSSRICSWWSRCSPCHCSPTQPAPDASGPPAAHAGRPARHAPPLFANPVAAVVVGLAVVAGVLVAGRRLVPRGAPRGGAAAQPGTVPDHDRARLPRHGRDHGAGRPVARARGVPRGAVALRERIRPPGVHRSAALPRHARKPVLRVGRHAARHPLPGRQRRARGRHGGGDPGGRKTLVTAVPAWFAGFPLRTSLLAGAAIAQVGEFSFVLGSRGQEAGLLAAADYQTFLAAAVLTMAVTPLVAAALPRLARATPARGGCGGWLAEQRRPAPAARDSPTT